jgi:prepilin-type N-terminal cleavage/methylation domain-containing protein
MMNPMMRVKGLTLIEMVITIVIVGLLVGAVTFSIRDIFSLWDFWSFRTEIVSQGRIALMRMVREIRQINNDTSVLIADSSILQFNDTSGQTIEYRLNGTDIMRNSNVLANGTSSLRFTYFNETSVPLTPLPLDAENRSAIYLIGIDVTIVAGNQNRTLKTQVCPRNI